MAASAISWIRSEENPATLEHSARTAVAAVGSLLAARLLGMPEAYWAPISALIVMQSTLGDSLRISAQRFAGTALGAFVAALISLRFRDNTLAFGLAILAIGILCAGGRIERALYRYASITLAIVMLVVHRESGWIIALHRFIEVSTGIAVGLAVTAAWPEHPRRHAANS